MESPEAVMEVWTLLSLNVKKIIKYNRIRFQEIFGIHTKKIALIQPKKMKMK